MVASVAFLFKHLLFDWKKVRATDEYMNNTTPWDKLKYNSIFYSITACLSIIMVLFIYFILSAIKITPPF